MPTCLPLTWDIWQDMVHDTVCEKRHEIASGSATLKLPDCARLSYEAYVQKHVMLSGGMYQAFEMTSISTVL